MTTTVLLLGRVLPGTVIQMIGHRRPCRVARVGEATADDPALYNHEVEDAPDVRPEDLCPRCHARPCRDQCRRQTGGNTQSGKSAAPAGAADDPA